MNLEHNERNFIYSVSKVPSNLDELGDGLKLWETLNSELSSTEGQIAPIHEQFGILEKYEVAIQEEVRVYMILGDVDDL